MKQHLNIKISGRVQGVFFRDTAKKRADELGLKGFIRNESGGTVYVEVEGGESAIGEFVKWCRRGSASAKVEKVEVKDGDFGNFSDFSVL